MTRRFFSSALAFLVMSVAVPAAFSKDDGGGHGGPGGGGGGQKLQRSITLTPTPTGARENAWGTASWRIQGNNQRFKVDFDIDVPNGSIFLIEVDGSTFGSVKVSLGEAEFEIEDEDGHPLPPPLNPVSKIRQVTVVNSSGTAVLQGSF